MTADEEIERLRRLAYGPRSSETDREAAGAALRALEAQGPLARRESVEPTTAAAVADPADAAPTPSDGEFSDAESGERRIRAVWLVPIVAVSLAAGALGALGATGQFRPAAQYNETSFRPSSPSSEGASQQIPGDLDAADAWFDSAATASDSYPFPEMLDADGIDDREVRFAFAAGSGWNVWVARSDSGELCLLIAAAADGSGATTCVERARFAEQGMFLGLGERSAHWYGGEVTTFPLNVSPGEDGAIPPIPDAGPGHPEAAVW